MTNWVLLIIASILEISWATGLKYAAGPLEWVLTLLCIAGSFFFLVLATKRMAASLAYVFFVIFGTIGAYLLDVIFFEKRLTAMAIIAIAVMLFCIVKLNRANS